MGNVHSVSQMKKGEKNQKKNLLVKYVINTENQNIEKINMELVKGALKIKINLNM